MRFEIFESSGKNGSLATDALWLTWSQSFLYKVEILRSSRRFPQKLKLVSVPGCKPYDSSYEVHDLRDAFVQDLMPFAKSLLYFETSDKLFLLDDMINKTIDKRVLLYVLALLREGICKIQDNRRAALVSPVTTCKKDQGFSLHSDLFLCQKLLLIFDDVPDDGTGVSLFVSRKELLQCCKIAGVPSVVSSRLRNLMSDPISKDSFNEFFSLLHDGQHQWNLRLANELRNTQRAILLKHGQGYLIGDRMWLHGRTASSAPIKSNRFRRLVFDID